MSRHPPPPGDCELIIHTALDAGDMQAVVMGLKLLAIQDPHRAQLVYDILKLAITTRTHPHAPTPAPPTGTPEEVTHGQ